MISIAASSVMPFGLAFRSLKLLLAVGTLLAMIAMPMRVDAFGMFNVGDSTANRCLSNARYPLMCGDWDKCQATGYMEAECVPGPPEVPSYTLLDVRDSRPHDTIANEFVADTRECQQHNADSIFNADTSSKWNAANCKGTSTPPWVIVDLGAAYSISRVAIWDWGDAAHDVKYVYLECGATPTGSWNACGGGNIGDFQKYQNNIKQWRHVPVPTPSTRYFKIWIVSWGSNQIYLRKLALYAYPGA